ncbi:hypothetical protein [Desulfospira joergensenii]|uniref:hypothetical protein n=1 Tax=Desulfospira joergensenii TaxID=53329 RepID=UPI0003B3CF36|nr:hypothetical protein [Desulfospira joergensenii]
MQSKFHLKTQKRNQNLYIDLYGTFDGSSAFELVNIIQKEKNRNQSIFIDTSRLSKSFPFGRAVLDSHLPNNSLRERLHFLGRWANRIRPEGSRTLKIKKSG